MRKILFVAPAVLLASVPLSAADEEDALPSALEAGWEGCKVCELRHQTETHRVLRCTFPPGVGHEKHFHPAHYGFALSGGTMQLTDSRGTRRAELATGSDYSSEGTEWHEVVNVGDTTVTYLIVEEL
jgi:quercetin dioxygenase-like cupin family protein